MLFDKVMKMDIQKIFEIGKTVTEMGLVLTLLYALLVIVAIRFTLRTYHRFAQKAIEINGKTAATTFSFFGSILKVAIYALGIYLILEQFTIFKSLGNLLLGASSVIGAAVALASQESIANLVGGIFLSLYQPCRVDDMISLPEKNITGRIKEISLRHTIILTSGNTEIIIPNSVMNSAIIENKDRSGKIMNFLIFSISYDSDLDLAMKIMAEKANEHPCLFDVRTEEEVQQNKPLVKAVVYELNDYSVDLRLSFPTKDASDGFTMRCDLLKNIKEAFDQAGILIPYPISEIIQSKRKSE